MMDLMVDFGIGQVLGVIAAWYLSTGEFVIIPWLVIIIGWKLGDMLLPNPMLNSQMMPLRSSPWQNLDFSSIRPLHPPVKPFA
jgi:hypothetical protein